MQQTAEIEQKRISTLIENPDIPPGAFATHICPPTIAERKPKPPEFLKLEEQ